mgnify:CR=1 FL=1
MPPQSGNTARKIIQAPAVPKKAVLPKPHSKQKRKVIYVDPVAFLSIMVAFCLVLTMTVGIVQFTFARREAVQMEEYVAELSSRNQELSEAYRSGYDIHQIEKSAKALGMVSRDDVQTVVIQVTAPQQAQAATLWERIGTFLTTLFA